MNIAFSAILFLILLIPGLIFNRVRRNSGEFANLIPPSPEPFSVEVASAVFFSAIIHAVICVAVSLIGLAFKAIPEPNLSALLMLLLGRFGDKDIHLLDAIGSIAGYPFWILAYFVVACGSAVGLGMLAGRHCDKTSTACRLQASHDAAIGEWRQFFHLKPGFAVLVTAVVDMGGTSYLFAGMLTRLYFNGTCLPSFVEIVKC